MDIKDLKIIPPKGMEYYIENGEIRFREIKKNLIYNDIAKELFANNRTYYISMFGGIKNINKAEGSCAEENNCTSEKQAQKLLAINKLMNVAKYLNGDWKPDWEEHNGEFKYYIQLYHKLLNISYTTHYNGSFVYFKSEELAKQAIEILGEETIKLALSTDW